MRRTIKERFKGYSDEKEVYDAMQINDPEYWINDKEYGNDKLIFLAERFSTTLAHADLNKETVLIEWAKFKIEIKNSFEKTPVYDSSKSILTCKTYAFGNFIFLLLLILSISGPNSNFDCNFSMLTSKRLSLNYETMEDLVICNNHLSNQSERGETIKQVHQLYMLKRRHVQVDNFQEVIRDEMAYKEEGYTFYDDSEKLSNDRETHKNEEIVTSTIMPREAM